MNGKATRNLIDKEFNEDELIEEYKRTLTICRETNHSYDWAPRTFILANTEQASRGLLIKIFKTLIEREGETIDLCFGLGLLHCMKAMFNTKILIPDRTKNHLLIWVPIGHLKTAFSYFNKVHKKDRNDSLNYVMIILCLAIRGYIKRANQLFTSFNLRKSDDRNKESIAPLLQYALFYIKINTAIDLHCKSDFDGALKHLEEASSLQKNERQALLLKFVLYGNYKSMGYVKSAICVLKEVKKITHAPLLYYLIAKEYVNVNNYKLASLYFYKGSVLSTVDSKIISGEKGEQLNDDDIHAECKILHEFSIAMFHWQKHKISDWKSLRDVQRHFCKCADLIDEKKKCGVAYKKFKVLPYLIEIDQRMIGLKESWNFVDLRIRAVSIMLSLLRFADDFDIRARDTGGICTDIISRLFDAKICYVVNLAYILQVDDSDGNRCLPSHVETQHYATFDEWLKACRTFFENNSFRECVVAFDDLEKFKEKIGDLSREDISEDEQLSLIRMLLHGFEAMDGECSYKGMSKTALVEQQILLGIQELTEDHRKHDEQFGTIIGLLEKKSPSKAISIDFVPECVRVSILKEPLFRKSLERYLFEHLLLRKKLHYLHGFVVFKERGFDFSCIEFVDDPMHRFGKCVATIRGKLKDLKDESTKEPAMTIYGPADGYYELIEEAELASNMKEAMRLYEVAHSSFAEEDYQTACRILSGNDGVLNKYNNLLDAYVLLAECYAKIGLQNITVGELRTVKDFLQKYDSWYREAIDSIEEWCRKKDRETTESEEQVLAEIVKQHCKICEALDKLAQYPIPKTDEDLKWDKFNAIQKVIAKNKSEEGYEITSNELKCRGELFGTLKEPISRVVNKRLRYLGAMDPRTMERAEQEVYMKAFYSLIDTLRKTRYSRDDFKAFSDVMNEIISKVNRSFEPAKTSTEKKLETLETELMNYNRILREEGIENLSPKGQERVFRKKGWRPDRFWKVIKYLETEKESMRIIEGKDEGKEI